MPSFSNYTKTGMGGDGQQKTQMREKKNDQSLLSKERITQSNASIVFVETFSNIRSSPPRSKGWFLKTTGPYNSAATCDGQKRKISKSTVSRVSSLPLISVSGMPDKILHFKHVVCAHTVQQLQGSRLCEGGVALQHAGQIEIM